MGLKNVCDLLLQQIDSDLIEKEDRKLLKSIKIKNKFIPSFLARFYRIVR